MGLEPPASESLRRAAPTQLPPATTPRTSRFTASRAAVATAGSAAVCDTCCARSATDFMVRTKSPGASSPTSRPATPMATARDAPRAHEVTAVERPGAGWRVRGTPWSSSMPRIALGHLRRVRTAPGEVRRALVAQPVLQGAALFAASAGPMVLARDPPSPARFEDHGGQHAGEDGGLHLGQDVVAERLRDQQIALVVDARQLAAFRRQRPALHVPHLLQHVQPVVELAGQRIGRPGLPLREGPAQDGVRRLAVEAAHQVHRQVVGRPEGRAKVRGWGHRDPGDLRKVDLARPRHDRVAFRIEPPAAGPARQLEVLARGERGPPGAAVLGEALDHHRAGRHVDAQRQGLGGEHDLQQAGLEALLHRLAEERDQACMVRRESALQPFEPLVVAEHAQVLVGQRLDATLGDLPDGDALVRVGEAHAVAHDLADRVVACGAAEDEHDRGQHLELAELVHHLGPQGRTVGQARPASSRLPVGGPAPLQGAAYGLVDAQPLAAGPPIVLEQGQHQNLLAFASMHGKVVPQHDRPLALDDHRGVAPHRAQPIPQLTGVVHRRRETDEADLGRRHHQDFLPDAAPVGILNEMDLVEDDRVEALEKVRAGEEHVAQHLGGHDDDGRPRAEGGVPRQQPDVVLAVGGGQLAVLLVGECLERRGVERLAPRRQGAMDRVRRHERLARSGGRRDEHRVPGIEGGERIALKVVECERQVGLELRRPGRLLDGPRERGQRPSSFPMAMEMK